MKFDAYERLRAEVDRGLATMQEQGAPLEDALAELVKLAAVVCLPMLGPGETIAGLRSVTRQLEAAFPKEATPAQDALAMSDTAGTA